MADRKDLMPIGGFSLIEMLVVLGLIGMLGAASAPSAFENSTLQGARADRDTLMNALLLARSRAQSGACFSQGCRSPSNHGVHVSPARITVFEGDSYRERSPESDLAFVRRGRDTAWAGNQDFVFQAQSGSAVPHSYAFGQPPAFEVVVSADGGINSISLLQ